MNELFRRFAQKASDAVGSTWAFLLAVLIVIVWAISGPLFNFSNLWQLIINTGTTIITFLMIFLVQNTQNRETKATQLKLDELIRAQKNAQNKLMGIETKPDKQLKRAIKKEKQNKNKS
jgi:low affinity Fe/Cu permease